MSLLALPALVFAGSGSRTDLVDRDSTGFYRLSIGNIGYSPSSATYKTDIQCKHHPGQHCIRVGTNEIPMNTVVTVLTTCELLQICVLVMSMIHLRRRIAVAEELETDNTSVTDYSIMVTGLPEGTTAEEVAKHFSDLYPLNAADWKNRPSLAGARPVQAVPHAVSPCFPSLMFMCMIHVHHFHHPLSLLARASTRLWLEDGWPNARCLNAWENSSLGSRANSK